MVKPCTWFNEGHTDESFWFSFLISSHLKEEIIPILHKLFAENEGALSSSFCETSITITTQWDKTLQESYRTISLMNIDTNVFNKMSANWIHQHVKRIMLHGQLGFTSQMRGCFNIWKCNRIKDSRWRIAFDKNPIPIHDKNSEQTGNKRELPQPDKEHLWKTHSSHHT